MRLIYDDVGSFPIPQGVEGKRFERAFLNSEEWALRVFNESMSMKIDAGVQVPCYPQLRDMNDQFLEPLKDPEIVEEPYLIREEKAVIPEIVALENMNMNGRKIKMCITGPLELSIAEFGNEVYQDVMMNIARSLNRFIKNAESIRDLDIGVVSIDEPSLGTNPNISVDEEMLIKAWDIAGATEKDVQIHLHSPLPVENACRSESIDVIDIGTAATPENLEMIDPEMLESYGKRLRAGISRSDISSLAAEFNEDRKVNVWTDKDAWEEFLTWVEPPRKISERIGKAFDRFGDLLKYVGPDCGLKGARSRSLAHIILKNSSKGIDLFQKGN
ncbi:hypothetical protein AKJ58_00870 [candidate division MSBL1 archaeon SCGC-AAA385D11]|uniref:Cobalamin-independent methionine synthase MetE C-terminal/archaeal domain-containing protein n=1 Tax=candidate division MSBL1 archaeon SCGC-AAA385D11 TaxID=1698286 RepID=A0A133VNV3_9EURY|nr:hypothetical protein AKJ58_00870 [candidate division MSBL1 archaeon SCGC-AAA385D11]